MTSSLELQNSSNPFSQNKPFGGQGDRSEQIPVQLPKKVQELIKGQFSSDQLLQFFKEYTPESDFVILQVHRSAVTKCKRYKECVYYGEFLNGKRHGNGVMIYNNGRAYEGLWENDFKHGKGYERFSNNSKYQGGFMNGKPEGIGIYIWANGQSYEGQWVNGRKHGSGMWRGARGDSYIGQWKDGKADGVGVHTWVNGDKYEGEFSACLKHGEGTQKFANGDLYVGSYYNGKPWGYGQYYWANGSFFKGNFHNGLRHGDGVWKRGPGDSDKYQGVYQNDKKCGYGIFTWASGNVYKGNYFDDMRHGYGEMYWSDGSCYKGNWQKGIQHGQGQITIPGEQPRKGLFESNVLISANDQFTTNNNPMRQSRQQDQQGAKKSLARRIGVQSKFRMSSESDRFSSHSKGGPPSMSGKGKLILRPSNNTQKPTNTNRAGLTFRTRMSFGNSQGEALQQTTSQATGGFNKQFHTSKFSQSDIQPKQKIPHSSFYLHQITKNSKRPFSRETAHLSLGRQSKVSLGFDTSATSNNHRVRRIQTGVKRSDMVQEMKYFTNEKVSYMRQPSRSIKQ